MKSRFALPIVFAFAFPHLVMPAQAQVVPGTGQQIVEVFDDFEDPDWSYTFNLPKSSANIDKVERHPSGFSNNRLFLESLYRGTPDFVRRVETPSGGIPGSTGALAMQTLHSGIPGQTSGTFQQDDLIASVQQKLGYMLPVSWTPSYVCRIYVPPFDKWERRNGSHFGFRADCITTISTTKSMGRFFKNFGTTKKQEQYWPGFFIQLHMKNSTGQKEDFATILIRSDDRGHEVPGPNITRPGWWTLGMTFTPNGKVHYYAHEGVGNLTAKDHIYSGFPYGYTCEQTSTYFFNIVNQDDGHTWSTRWIVDDPKVYVATGNYRPPVQQQAAQNAPTTVQAQTPTQVQAPTAKVMTSNAAAPSNQSVTAKTVSMPVTSVPAPEPAPKVASNPDVAPQLPSPATAPNPPEAPAADASTNTESPPKEEAKAADATAVVPDVIDEPESSTSKTAEDKE
jgi:hypothetical protein